MPPKKGLSVDQKREKLLEYMHEHKEVYSLKELEKNASKAKGIVEKTIKEILELLVSDGAVECDKIGSGNFYWALPSQSRANATTKIAKAEKELNEARAHQAELEAKVAALQSARPVSATRAVDLRRHTQLKSQAHELQAEVDKYADSDPDKMKLLENGAEICKTAANRWTDTVVTLIGQMRERQSERSEKDILENYGLPTKNFDNIP